MMHPNPEMNELAASDPQPGDYWHELCGGVCLVVARRADMVCICREKHIRDRYYSFVRPEWLRLEAFQEWLRYRTRPGYWADLGQRGMDVSSYAAEIPGMSTKA